MFPGSHAEIYRNEEGEVLGWDYPSNEPPNYCDRCGWTHMASVDCDEEEEEEE